MIINCASPDALIEPTAVGRLNQVSYSGVPSRMKAHVERVRPHVDPSPEALGEYRGKWVAILHGAIVASGERAIEVLRRMDEEHPGEKPVVYRVPAGEVMLL